MRFSPFFKREVQTITGHKREKTDTDFAEGCKVTDLRSSKWEKGDEITIKISRNRQKAVIEQHHYYCNSLHNQGVLFAEGSLFHLLDLVVPIPRKDPDMFVVRVGVNDMDLVKRQSVHVPIRFIPG